MVRKKGGIRRDFCLPVLKNNGMEAITNEQKAEMLAKAFVKLHSSQNIMRRYHGEQRYWRKTKMYWE